MWVGIRRLAVVVACVLGSACTGQEADDQRAHEQACTRAAEHVVDLELARRRLDNLRPEEQAKHRAALAQAVVARVTDDCRTRAPEYARCVTGADSQETLAGCK